MVQKDLYDNVILEKIENKEIQINKIKGFL
jgi:hypothetical protein